MKAPIDPTRRRLLRATGELAAIGLAGCTSAPQATDTADQSGAPTTADDHEEEEPHEDADHHDEEEPQGDDGHHEEEIHHDDETTHAEGGGHGADGPQSHVQVAMQTTNAGHHFHPHVAWVEVGGTVTFLNESGMHTATAYHPDNDQPLRMPEGAESFDSGLLTEAGATFEHTFETEGVYDIYCTPHEQVGMIGSVLVGRPDPHDQPGLSEPDPGMSETVSTKLASLNEQVDVMLGHTH